MEIVFIADGNEKAYSKYIPEIQRFIRFKNSGENQEVPDAIAEQLMKDFPRMFGRTVEDVKKIRGTFVEKVLSKTEPSKKEEPQKAQHPMVSAFQKVEKMVSKTGGNLAKVDKKPARRLNKKGTK